MSVRVIVFDYDGTLVDSNAIKRGAYRPLFPPGARQDDLLAAVLEDNPAGTRCDIIREMLIRGATAVQEADSIHRQVEALAGRYDQIATEGAATCPERPGAGAGLAWLADRYPLYLLSATPEKSLQGIVSRRGWTGFFRVVRGAPCVKSEELRAMAAAEGVSCGEVLMVGDSDMDHQAARDAGTAYFHMESGMAMDVLLNQLDQNQQQPRETR